MDKTTTNNNQRLDTKLLDLCIISSVVANHPDFVSIDSVLHDFRDIISSLEERYTGRTLSVETLDMLFFFADGIRDKYGSLVQKEADEMIKR